ncbi:type IV secretory system conjugative DNA transfer family protein [Nocardioides iriomotensis]|uniref:Type IV secretory system conjugative DNA transfer family protein n=1 Tax=Nocardioides iriomotensis TaxID=715784 RepID=A0A4V1Z2L2_9ACTN|nr:type IV secretory system conjugative DNA transfer family protein [Nocardioides iriomotensis]RYU14796.1 type IV secretory system conjugative DNA transfer family protein [Nocardioides iriomotensis]
MTAAHDRNRSSGTDMGLLAVVTCLALAFVGAAQIWATSVLAGREVTVTARTALAFWAELLAGGSANSAWEASFHRPAPPSWLFTTTALVAISLCIALAWVGLKVASERQTGTSEGANWATRREESALVVTRDTDARHYRLVAGISTLSRRLLAGEDCVSAVVFGPNGSGKTAGLVVPNTLEWSGSVVMTTAKPQDLDAVVAARARIGPVWIIAPGGAPGRPTASWSPVDYATDADAADRMAGWLVDSSGMTGDPRARPWNAQARKYLKGLLLAARLSGRGMAGFVEWAYDGELASEHVSQILAEHGYVDVLREYRSTWRIHEEGKGSVMFTAFGLADTYNRPGVMQATTRSDFSADDFFGSAPATLLLVTPQSDVERFTPYFTSLISSIVHAAEQHAAALGGPVNPRLLLALDEAGNVFRYPRLPHLLTTARGNGVQLLLAYHDIAQIEHLFGGRDVARTILSNAKLRMLLPGVGDVETLRYFSDLLGQTAVAVTSHQTGPDGRRSSAQSEHHEPLAPIHRLQQLPRGQALLLYENLPPAKVRLRFWFKDRGLRDLHQDASQGRGDVA